MSFLRRVSVAKSVTYETATRASAVPTYSNTTAAQKKKLYFCTSTEKYYYYNEISLSWVEVSDNCVYSAFIQTANGFKLSGIVKIDGDLITEGTISGITISGCQFMNSAETHAMEMSNDDGTGYGTFRLYNSYYGNVPYFAIYDNTFGGIGLKCAGATFLGCTNSGGATTTPYGTWDFSSATVKGLSAIAVFG